MSIYDELGMRMKSYYEDIPKTKLMRRTPVAIRIDGKAFHTFTHGFLRPFDHLLMKCMQDTAKYLCENIQGCVLSYQQSDEITLILTDYKKLTTSAWFDYEVQKMCSISASMATMAFNKIFCKNVECLNDAVLESLPQENLEEASLKYDYDIEFLRSESFTQYLSAWKTAADKGAVFDSRCFNIPKEEVANLIYWRQLDAIRNSIQMAGQSYFSSTQLHGKSQTDIKDMLLTQKNINWNDYPTAQQRGSCCIKEVYQDETAEKGSCMRSRWVVDKNIPIFKDDARRYIEDRVYFGEGYSE
jgi:tRNA(His) 5'-end guanylyltransferase